MSFFGSACGNMGGSLTKANDLMSRAPASTDLLCVVVVVILHLVPILPYSYVP